MAESPLVNIGDLAKPAILLIEKVSNAFGRHFDPNQTIRMAEADAGAHRIIELGKAETEIEVTALRQRAASRLLNEEMTKQENIESIVGGATKYLTDEASPESIEDDWIRNFLGKCSIVSDEDMQKLWARILAGKGNSPGTFSRRTVNLVADLDKRDAEMFVDLCSFVWEIDGQRIPVFVNLKHEVYKSYEIDLLRLRELGLVTIGGTSFALRLSPLPKNVIASYCGKELNLALPEDTANSMDVGRVRFTVAGLELSSVCESAEAPRFYEYVHDVWASQSFVPPRESQPTGSTSD